MLFHHSPFYPFRASAHVAPAFVVTALVPLVPSTGDELMAVCLSVVHFCVAGVAGQAVLGMKYQSIAALTVAGTPVVVPPPMTIVALPVAVLARHVAVVALPLAAVVMLETVLLSVTVESAGMVVVPLHVILPLAVVALTVTAAIPMTVVALSVAVVAVSLSVVSPVPLLSLTVVVLPLALVAVSVAVALSAEMYVVAPAGMAVLAVPLTALPLTPGDMVPPLTVGALPQTVAQVGKVAGPLVVTVAP